MVNLNEHKRMLNYTVEEMIKEWKLRRGFFEGSRSCTAERDDTIDVDSLMKREIDAWYGRLLREAPTDMVPVEDLASTCFVKADSDGVAVVTLPERCVRPLSLRLPGWSRSVSRFVAADSEEALRQRNEWTRAGTECPVVVEGDRRLTAYCIGETSVYMVSELLSVAYPGDGSYVFSQAAWDFFPDMFERL